MKAKRILSLLLAMLMVLALLPATLLSTTAAELKDGDVIASQDFENQTEVNPTDNTVGYRVISGFAGKKIENGVLSLMNTAATGTRFDLQLWNAACGEIKGYNVTLSMELKMIGAWNKCGGGEYFIGISPDGSTWDKTIKTNVGKLAIVENGGTTIHYRSDVLPQDRFTSVDLMFIWDETTQKYTSYDLYIDGVKLGNTRTLAVDMPKLRQFVMFVHNANGVGVELDSIAFVKGHVSSYKYAHETIAAYDFGEEFTLPANQNTALNGLRVVNGYAVNGLDGAGVTIENGIMKLSKVNSGDGYIQFAKNYVNYGLGTNYNLPAAIKESFTVSMKIKPVDTRSGGTGWNRGTGAADANKDFFYFGDGTTNYKYVGTNVNKLVIDDGNGDVIKTKALPLDDFSVVEFMLQYENGAYTKMQVWLNGELVATRALSNISQINALTMFYNNQTFWGMEVDWLYIYTGNYSKYQQEQTASADLVNVGWQQGTSTSSLDLRFITGVKNAADYKTAGYAIYVNGKLTETFEKSTTKIYKSMLATDKSGNTYEAVTAAAKGVDGLYAATLRNIPTSGYYVITVVAFATTASGRVYSQTGEYTVTDGVVAAA